MPIVPDNVSSLSRSTSKSMPSNNNSNTHRNGDGGEFEDWIPGNWCYVLSVAGVAVASSSSTGVAHASATKNEHDTNNDNDPPVIKQEAVMKKEVTAGTSSSNNPLQQQPQNGVVLPMAIKCCGRDDSEETMAEDATQWEAGNWSWLPQQEEEKEKQQQQSRKNRKRQHNRTQAHEDGKLKEEEDEADADDGNTDQDNAVDGMGIASSSSSPRLTTTTTTPWHRHNSSPARTIPDRRPHTNETTVDENETAGGGTMSAANPDSTASSWWSSSFSTRTAARTKRRKMLTQHSSTSGTIEDDATTTVHTTTGETSTTRKNEACGPEHEDEMNARAATANLDTCNDVDDDDAMYDTIDANWEPGNWCWILPTTTFSDGTFDSRNNQRSAKSAAKNDCVAEEDGDSCGDTDDEPDDVSTGTYDEYHPANTDDDDDDDVDEDDEDDDADPDVDPDADGDNATTATVTPTKKYSAIWNAQWNEMFEKLVTYKNVHNSVNVPQDYEKDHLGCWVSTQRQVYRKKRISTTRINRLESIGFVWNELDEKWNEMFERLVLYKHEFQSMKVPWDSKLGEWSVNQRTLYTNNKLSQDRINRLESIAFVWYVNDEGWMAKYRRLCAYKREFKSTNVPMKYKPDPQLGSWVNHQRSRKNKLSTQRVQLLNSIGFFDPLKATVFDERWMAKYRRLCDYKKEFKSTNVPRGYVSDPQLGVWVSHQRHDKNKLSKQRVQLLNSIGFFDPLEARTHDVNWMAKYDRLCAYKEEFKSTNVPMKYKPDPQLAGWVSKQRFRRNQLSTERVQLLDSIGFFDPLEESTFDKKWMEMYDRLCAYKKEFKSTKVPYTYKPDPQFGAWVSTQRYKKNTLSTRRFKLLNSIGFFS